MRPELLHPRRGAQKRSAELVFRNMTFEFIFITYKNNFRSKPFYFIFVGLVAAEKRTREKYE